MEKEREQMKGHFENLTKAVSQQDGQIKNLLGIIDRFGDYNVKVCLFEALRAEFLLVLPISIST